MKKTLALLLCLFMLIGCLNVGFLSTSADVTVDPATYRSIFFYDFTGELLSYASADTWKSPDRWAVNGGLFGASDSTTAKVSYSDTYSALKVTGNGTDMVDLDVRAFDRRKGVVVEDYKTLAIKVKLADTNTQLQSVSMGLHDGPAAATCTDMYTLKSVPTYAKTTNWQLVTVDLSSSNWSQELIDMQAKVTTTPNDWWAAHINLTQAGYKSPVYVAWVGVFADAATAQKYYDATASAEPIEPDDPNEPTVPTYFKSDNDSAFLFDFTLKANYTDMVDYRSPAQDTTNPRTMVNFKSAPLDLTNYGKVSYNAVHKALKLVGDGSHAPMLDLRCLDWRSGLDITKYHTLAIKVKLSNRDTEFQNAEMYVNDGAAASSANTLRELPIIPSYAHTNDWQILLIDISEANYDATLKAIAQKNIEDTTVSHWWGTRLTLGAVGTTDPIYVAWVGIFENDGRALAYHAETDAATSTDWLFDFSSQAKYDDIRDFGVGGNTERPRTLVNENNNADSTKYSTVAFDTTNQALKVTANGNAPVKLDLQCLDWRSGLDYKNTTTLAMKVKLRDTSAVFQSGGIFVNDGAASSSANTKHEVAATPDYAKTTDWQLVVIDIDPRNWEQPLKNIETLNNAAGTSSVFWRAQVGLAQAGYTGAVYLEWIGYFTSESDAIAQYLKTTPGVDLTTVKLSAVPTPKPKHTSFFYDFSGPALYQENIDNARVAVNYDPDCSIEYDADQQALKLTPDGSKPPYLELMSNDRVYNINAGYVLAVKVKITSKLASFQSARMYAKDDASVDKTIGGNDSIDEPGRIKDLRSYPSYTNTVGWQLLLVDLSDANRFENLANKTGVWYGTRLTLSATAAAGPIYVAWAGVFDNKEAAQAYFDYTTKDNDDSTFEDQDDPSGVDAPTPLFWSFFTKPGVSQVMSNGDTVLDFDSSEHAMVVEAKDTNKDGVTATTPGDIVLGAIVSIEKGLTMEDYPIFALRVKLSRDEIIGGMMNVVSAGSRESAGDGMIDSFEVDIDTMNYQPTTEWQTIVIDYRENLTAAFFSGGDWQSINLHLLDENQTLPGDKVLVQWAGAFASKADLNNYLIAVGQYEGEDDPENPDDPSDSPKTGDTVADIALAVVFLVTAAGATLYVRKRRVGSCR